MIGYSITYRNVLGWTHLSISIVCKINYMLLWSINNLNLNLNLWIRTVVRSVKQFHRQLAITVPLEQGDRGVWCVRSLNHLWALSGRVITDDHESSRPWWITDTHNLFLHSFTWVFLSQVSSGVATLIWNNLFRW